MVDFAKLAADAKAIRESGEQFVGYCRICDTKSKLYESNIIKLNNNPRKDLFKCSRCKCCSERDEMIPF